MYMSDYPNPGLSGNFRKKFRNVTKVAAHVAAAVVTGGSSLAVTAAIINAERQKKAQQYAEQQEKAAMAQLVAPEAVPPSAGAMRTMSVRGGESSPYTSPQAAALPYTSPQDASPQSASSRYAPSSEASGSFAPAGSFDPEHAKPPWMMPALIGGGVLAGLMLLGGRRE